MNALNNLGYEYYLTKQYKKAAKIFEQCLEEKRDEEYASNNYVKTLIAMKRFADAKAFIDTGKYKISSSLKKKIENKNNKDKPVLEDEPAISEVNERSKSSSAKAVEFSSEEILEDEIVNRLEKGMKTFGRKLKMYRRKGKYGRQYTIPYGRIDVLAEDDEGNVYIIELKKNSGYDDAYDEHILKYFEWFDKHPITDKKTYGIICLNNPSKELIEKVRRDERVELYNYKVMFDKVE
jgi:tetratricopeptide (TPR) repeat protein